MEAIINNEKFTKNYTAVTYDIEYGMEYNAPHRFKVYKAKDVAEMYNGMTAIYDYPLATVDFQCGPIKENGVNGVSNEDLLLMVITRLQHFQQSKYACEENAEAIEGIMIAVEALRRRTNKRIEKGEL